MIPDQLTPVCMIGSTERLLIWAATSETELNEMATSRGEAGMMPEDMGARPV